jgi:DNA adenine methylase
VGSTRGGNGQPGAVCSPFLRWAGSKRRLLHKLTPYWPSSSTRYVEPFAGSAALFFAIQPKAALLSDINGELVKSLATVRNHPREVYAALLRIPRGSRSFYRIRKKPPASFEAVERAARFIYLNRFCFNGLYRTNGRGEFNVPFASARTGDFPSLENFLRSASMLRRARIVEGDFESVLRDVVRAGDFVYLDPPYAVGNRRVFRQYGPQSFGLADLERLQAVLEEINARGAKFVLSYAWCAEAKRMFSRWSQCRVYTQRNIAGFSRHRRKAAELIVSNTAPARAAT